jgi:predicted 3-demethylubiquinone-9 3-methyltransferase (glyoxalase superfamily)
MNRIYTCLWFDKGQAEEAARLYTSLIPNSQITNVSRAAAETPSGPEGMVLTVDFTLDGVPYQGLNGGPDFRLSEAVSIAVECTDQTEVDRLWEALVADGGEHSVCGWLKDRFGLSWQIYPRRLTELLADPDARRARRTMEAMLKMTKIETAELEAAADGAPVTA